MSQSVKPAVKRTLPCGRTLEIAYIHRTKQFALFLDGLPQYWHPQRAQVEYIAMTEFLPPETEPPSIP